MTEETRKEVRRQIRMLFEEYNEAMGEGNARLLDAATARLEQEKARDDFKNNKAEAHARHGKSATTDVRYAGMAVAQEALGDNRWFLTQYPGYSDEATAHFAKATAIMGSIQYLMTRLAINE